MDTAPSTLHADLYRAPDRFAWEVDAVFRRTWACAGLAERVAEPGAYLATDVAGQPIIVVRDHDGVLRAFHNVCRHRGALLCDAGSGSLKRAIRCPYHAWAYGLDGALVGTPNVGLDEIDRTAYGLHAMPVAEWHGALFVDLGGAAGPFGAYIASHDDDPLWLARFGLGDLVSVRTTRRETAANWKIVVENYRECLHCPTVHPELVDLVPAYRAGAVQEAEPRADGGVGLKDGAAALTLAGACAVPPLPGLSAEEARSVYGAYLFPNCMIDVFGTYATLSVLHPCAADRTDVVIEYLLPPAVAADPRLQGDVDELIRFMEIVVEQDTDVAERAQRGIASRAFERGVYPDKDAALHAFNERYRALTGAD